MEKEQAIKQIIEKEWKMFHTVNGEERASCQNDLDGFRRMRGAQYEAWTAEICESYLADLTAAGQQGRNLPREKYIHMMKTTDPAVYEVFRGELPEVTPEKENLVDSIWAVLLVQTERMRETYPLLALGGRPLHASDEQPGQTSIETYQKGELLTYSEHTLQLLLAHIRDMESRGEDYAYTVQENTVLAAGYPSMKAAEELMLEQAKKRREAEVEAILKANTGCPNCRMPGQI